MHRKSIVRYLHRKWPWVHVIHDDLVPGLNPNGVAYNTVARHLGEAEIDTTEVTLAPEASPHHIRDSDLAMLASLERKSFLSLRQLIGTIHIPAATAYQIFTKPIGLERPSLRWISHFPSDAQKVGPTELHLSGVRMLQIQGQIAWHDIVTLDEPGFYYHTEYESMWLRSAQMIAESGYVTIQGKSGELPLSGLPVDSPDRRSSKRVQSQ